MLFGALGMLLVALGCVWRLLGGSWDTLVPLLGCSCVVLVGPWWLLGASGVRLGGAWVALGVLLGGCGVSWVPLGMRLGGVGVLNGGYEPHRIMKK